MRWGLSCLGLCEECTAYTSGDDCSTCGKPVAKPVERPVTVQLGNRTVTYMETVRERPNV